MTRFGCLCAIGVILGVLLLGGVLFYFQPDWLPFTSGPSWSLQRSVTATGEYLNISYRWKYHKDVLHTYQSNLSLSIPEDLYLYYQERPRVWENYSVYVTHPEDDECIQSIGRQIKKQASKYGLDPIQRVNFAASFVQQCIHYEFDSDTKGEEEYPRYPLETLLDSTSKGEIGVGDCEDTSILMAAILQAIGYDVVLVHFPSTDSEAGHMAIGVAGENLDGKWHYEVKGEGYYYLETTPKGWRLGEMPEKYKGKEAKIWELTPMPILTHTWEEANIKGHTLTLEVMVKNLGTARAEDVHILAAFDAGDNDVWNPQKSDPFNLAPESPKNITLHLAIPQGEHTRLVVQIVDDDLVVDQSYSEWFDS